jgi:4,5-DOPA dioxygenase extradiol
VLIIGSGAIVHNLKSAISLFSSGILQPFGWDLEFDNWVKIQLDNRNFQKLINSKKGKYADLAVPKPDHYFPMISSLGIIDKNEKISHSFEDLLPALSNRGFMVS